MHILTFASEVEKIDLSMNFIMIHFIFIILVIFSIEVLDRNANDK